MERPIGSIPLGATGDELVSAINTSLNNIELRFAELERQITDQMYTTSNVTTVRTFDADATTLDELADVVGTLVEDMKTRGLLR